MPELHEEIGGFEPQVRLRRKVEWYVERLPRGQHQRGQWRLTLDDVFLADENGTAVLELRGVVLRNGGTTVPIDSHQRIVNPPLLEPSAGGPISVNGRAHRSIDPVALVIGLLREQAGA